VRSVRDAVVAETNGDGRLFCNTLVFPRPSSSRLRCTHFVLSRRMLSSLLVAHVFCLS
jgi:hypothetical protein